MLIEFSGSNKDAFVEALNEMQEAFFEEERK